MPNHPHNHVPAGTESIVDGKFMSSYDDMMNAEDDGVAEKLGTLNSIGSTLEIWKVECIDEDGDAAETFVWGEVPMVGEFNSYHKWNAQRREWNMAEGSGAMDYLNTLEACIATCRAMIEDEVS